MLIKVVTATIIQIFMYMHIHTYMRVHTRTYTHAAWLEGRPVQVAVIYLQSGDEIFILF